MSEHRSRRFLYLELMHHHEEDFPNWLRLLGEQGYSADLYARADVHDKGILRHCSLSNYRLCDLEQLPKRGDGYDFVLLNTLMGYGFDGPVPEGFRPMLHHLRALGLPSISVIHEPFLWRRHYPKLAFTEVRGEKTDDLCLFGDRTIYRGGLPEVATEWRMRGAELWLRQGASTEVFRSDDGGETYAGAEPGHKLVLRRPPEPTLKQHLASGAHLVFTLCEHGAEYLRQDYSDVRWIHLEYLGDFPDAGAPERRIALPGMIDYGRRNFGVLFAAADQIRRLEMPIWVVGGERDTRAFVTSPRVRRLREDLRRYGLDRHVRLTGPLSYLKYLDFVRRSRYVLPLIDENSEGGGYLAKLSTSVALSINFGVPMIVNDRIAELYRLEPPTRYSGTNLAAGLRTLERIDEEAWADMRRRLLERRRELAAHNRTAVRQALDQIL